MRGTPSHVLIYGHVIGIIPACAGNTFAPTLNRADTRDHPRVCGEHFHNNRNVRTGMGSSPRVRGTRRLRLPGFFLPGIIPACAGNTSTCRRAKNSTRDHPRVCGEHAALNVEALAAAGSSPRVRGTLPYFGGWVEHHGIIPACAGNTEPRRTQTTRRRDHPRVCGEHLFQ